MTSKFTFTNIRNGRELQRAIHSAETQSTYVSTHLQDKHTLHSSLAKRNGNHKVTFREQCSQWQVGNISGCDAVEYPRESGDGNVLQTVGMSLVLWTEISTLW